MSDTTKSLPPIDPAQSAQLVSRNMVKEVEDRARNITGAFALGAYTFWKTHFGAKRDRAHFANGILKDVKVIQGDEQNFSDNQLCAFLAQKLDEHYAAIAAERMSWLDQHPIQALLGRGEPFPNPLEEELQAGNLENAILRALPVEVTFDTKMTIPGGNPQRLAEPVARQLAHIQSYNPELAEAILSKAILVSNRFGG
ncbi:MAG: hypothetical protein KDD70_00525 [Bdellovibrionales bacterium]|nr:hypothetical protein [Bdellovibrionales bacterium]